MFIIFIFPENGSCVLNCDYNKSMENSKNIKSVLKALYTSRDFDCWRQMRLIILQVCLKKFRQTVSKLKPDFYFWVYVLKVTAICNFRALRLWYNLGVEKSEKPNPILVYAVYYPIAVAEIVFFIINSISFFTKRDILTGSHIWHGSWLTFIINLLGIYLVISFIVQLFCIQTNRLLPAVFKIARWRDEKELVSDWSARMFFMLLIAAAFISETFGTSGGYGVIPAIVAFILLICGFIVLQVKKRHPSKPKSS